MPIFPLPLSLFLQDYLPPPCQKAYPFFKKLIYVKHLQIVLTSNLISCHSPSHIFLSHPELLMGPPLLILSSLRNSDHAISYTWKSHPEIPCLARNSLSLHLNAMASKVFHTYLLQSRSYHQNLLMSLMSWHCKNYLLFFHYKCVYYLLHLKIYYIKAGIISVLLSTISQQRGQCLSSERHPILIVPRLLVLSWLVNIGCITCHEWQ